MLKQQERSCSKVEFVQCESKKKKKKWGGEQEHNSLVSIARLLLSFYLHFSITVYCSTFFLTANKWIYPLHLESLPASTGFACEWKGLTYKTVGQMAAVCVVFDVFGGAIFKLDTMDGLFLRVAVTLYFCSLHFHGIYFRLKNYINSL